MTILRMAACSLLLLAILQWIPSGGTAQGAGKSCTEQDKEFIKKQEQQEKSQPPERMSGSELTNLLGKLSSMDGKCGTITKTSGSMAQRLLEILRERDALEDINIYGQALV
jgi:hypothetical protein